MEFITYLWLPMVLTAVALQMASTIAWTVSPHHHSDWKRLPGEEDLLEAMRRLNVPPGNYLFPFMTHGPDMNSPEFQAKFKAGPRGTVTFWALPNMGANIGWTFVFFAVTVFLIGYVAFAAIGTGATFSKVLQVVGTIGILTYSAAGIPNAIWFKRQIVTNLLDGIVYGLIAGLIFAWFWPR